MKSAKRDFFLEKIMYHMTIITHNMTKNNCC